MIIKIKKNALTLSYDASIIMVHNMVYVLNFNAWHIQNIAYIQIRTTIETFDLNFGYYNMYKNAHYLKH